MNLINNKYLEEQITIAKVDRHPYGLLLEYTLSSGEKIGFSRFQQDKGTLVWEYFLPTKQMQGQTEPDARSLEQETISEITHQQTLKYLENLLGPEERQYIQHPNNLLPEEEIMLGKILGENTCKSTKRPFAEYRRISAGSYEKKQRIKE